MRYLMAGASLFTLLDDIAMLLDDVAVLSKVAAKKTAGVLGDDLALNAEQVAGVKAERELPVVWAVTKGSFLNKLILVPTALIISAIAPWLITYLLILGGLFLVFEGVEKVLHKYLHSSDELSLAFHLLGFFFKLLSGCFIRLILWVFLPLRTFHCLIHNALTFKVSSLF